MYEAHFGLSRPPFKITPDTSLFYDGGKRGDILGALVYAVHRGEGIVKVVGEVGSGKTMLCRMLQLRLPKSVEIIYIANPSVSAQDILFVIAHELGMSVNKDASKHEVMHLLQDYLLQRHMEDKQVVLFIEEAQGMPLDTLEEIRLLSNLETDQNKLLQIILFGQPELDDNLAQQSIRQLRERITHAFNLTPLTFDEIHNYLNFRMREVGYTGPELVDINLARKIEQYSGGLLRRINIIADKILLSAFAESTHNLTSKHVLAAVNDSSFGEDVPKQTSPLWWIALALLLTGVALFFSQAHWMPLITGSSDLGSPLAQAQKIAKIEVDVTENDTQSVEPESLEKIAAVEPENSAQKAALDDENVVENRSQTGSLASSATVIEDSVSQNSEDATAPAQASESVAIKAVEKVVETKEKNIVSGSFPNLTDDNEKWLNGKLEQSRKWLEQANGDSVSIQVMMARASSVKDLVSYLRSEWPLDLDRTFLYKVDTKSKSGTKSQSIFRVFYSEFDTFASGKQELGRLPESVKVNVPYLQSVYRMREALL